MKTIKCTITKTYVSDKSKDGKEFKDKNGKKFWKMAIQTDATGDEWYSALAFKQDDRVMKLEKGEEQTITFYENNGFKNFKIPTLADLLLVRVEKMELEQKEMKLVLKKLMEKIGYEKEDKVEYPDEEAVPDDIPF